MKAKDGTVGSAEGGGHGAEVLVAVLAHAPGCTCPGHVFARHVAEAGPELNRLSPAELAELGRELQRIGADVDKRLAKYTADQGGPFPARFLWRIVSLMGTSAEVVRGFGGVMAAHGEAGKTFGDGIGDRLIADAKKAKRKK